MGCTAISHDLLVLYLWTITITHILHTRFASVTSPYLEIKLNVHVFAKSAGVVIAIGFSIAKCLSKTNK